MNICIRDMLGKVVFKKQVNNQGNVFTETLELSYLVNGIYLLDLTIDEERIVKKLVKN
jgi:Secretion system C-terminal sorting domain